MLLVLIGFGCRDRKELPTMFDHGNIYGLRCRYYGLNAIDIIGTVGTHDSLGGKGFGMRGMNAAQDTQDTAV